MQHPELPNAARRQGIPPRAGRLRASALILLLAGLAPALPAGAGTTDLPRLAPTAMHFNNCCMATSIAAAELNGDGDLDVVTGNGFSFDVSVLLSDGAGGFADPVKLPIDNWTIGFVAVALGDLDGDGHADLVVTAYNETEIRVYPGDGAGGFGDPTYYDVGDGLSPTAVALADITGDGLLDIVTANGGSNTVAVLANDGNGGFAAAVNSAAGAWPTALAIADLDEDGHLDVVTANADGNDASILFGDGIGHFAAPVEAPIGDEARPYAIAAADVTGDGHVDIVTANAATGGMPFPPPELPGTVSLLVNDGSGAFAPAQQLPAGAGQGRAHSIALADVTGDGAADIVVSRPNANTVSVLASDGAGDFAAAVNLPSSVGPTPVLVADITGDGHADIVVGNAVGPNISILPTDGAGAIGFDGRFGTGAYPHWVVAADFDGDGRIDLATANAISNDVSVLLNDGNGGFGTEVRYPVGVSPTSIAAGDIDGDGHPDLVTANYGGTGVSVLLGDGSGAFGAAVDFTFNGDPYAVALGDANGDGHLDIVTANSSFAGDSISLLLGDGSGAFGAATILQVGEGSSGTQGIVLADVTGDGHADIVTANLNSSDLSLLVGDGSGGFAPAVHLATDAGPVVVAAADVTGDGNIDLVTVNQTAQSVSVLAGDGSGGFAASANYAIYPTQVAADYDPWPWGLALGDLNGDGLLDIVTANTQNDTISVLPNDGSGGFATFVAFDTGALPGAVTIADIDGDGQPDVISSNRENGDIAVLYTRSRGDRIFADGFDGAP